MRIAEAMTHAQLLQVLRAERVQEQARPMEAPNGKHLESTGCALEAWARWAQGERA